MKTAFVEADHYRGGILATEHLISCGCRKIVCMRGPQNVSSGVKRFAGYRDTCQRYDRELCYVDCSYIYEDGFDATKILLEMYPDVDGIIACNDVVAFAVCKVLKQSGYRIPEDVQVVGYDDIQFDRLFIPELTTIKQPIGRIGEMAVEIILRHAAGIPYQEENILNVELIERQSTRKLLL